MITPKWFNPRKIRVTLDARPLLAQGVHPLDQVMKEASALEPGDIFTIITPFPPSPMIEKMNAIGFDSHSVQPETGLFHTYFCRAS